MTEINWGRFVAGALLAGVIAFVLDSFMHGVLLKPMWDELAKATGQTGNQMNPGDFVYYALYDLAKGAAAMWVYVLARKQLGAGPGTAALAGVTVWALAVPIALCGEIPFHWFGRRVALMWAIYALPLSVAFAVAGAALYRDKKA